MIRGLTLQGSKAIFTMVALTLLLGSLACEPSTPTVSPLDAAAAAQIREYDGQPLSSIKDFRENSLSGPRYVDPASYTLSVTGLVETELAYRFDEIVDGFEAHSKVVTLDCEEGWGVTLWWEGVLVRDVLDAASLLPEAKIVIFRSAEGYSTSLFLDYLYDNNIIMAHKMNDVTLPPELGFPFQIVAEGKWGYKWSKWVQEIEVSDNVLYEGYWESRGFSDVANHDQPFLD